MSLPRSEMICGKGRVVLFLSWFSGFRMLAWCFDGCIICTGRTNPNERTILPVQSMLCHWTVAGRLTNHWIPSICSSFRSVSAAIWFTRSQSLVAVSRPSGHLVWRYRLRSSTLNTVLEVHERSAFVHVSFPQGRLLIRNSKRAPSCNVEQDPWVAAEAPLC